MGRVKDLYLDIIDMYDNGYDAEDIAVVLNLPQDEVEQILKNLGDPAANTAPY